MRLLARRGLPALPAFYDYVSSNPGTNHQLITLFNSSTPVRLERGEWFLSAVNLSGVPANYTIMASDFALSGTNILIAGQSVVSQDDHRSFCLSWTSIPGLHYYVEGKAALTDSTWTTVSEQISATALQTTSCVPLPSTYLLFQGPGMVGLGLAIYRATAASTCDHTSDQRHFITVASSDQRNLPGAMESLAQTRGLANFYQPLEFHQWNLFIPRRR